MVIIPMPLGPPANPSDTQFVPRPEWYYLSVFQWLKYWHGPASVIGILVIPSILVIGVLALPFLDRSVERRPWKRPIAMGAYVFVFVCLVGLALRSQYSDSHDPGISRQVAQQKSDEAEYMRKPFEPELSSGSLTSANAALADPIAAKGKTIFEAQSCNACHGDNGIGSAAGPKLVGVGSKFDTQKLEALLKHPSAAMSTGGMTPTELNGEELKALIAYVSSLK